MLKLYSWTETYEQEIKVKRDDERKFIKRMFTIATGIVTTLYFFP